MNRTPKGSYGYIVSARKAAFLRTALMFFLCIGFFLAGRIATGTNRNALSIVAALFSLPTGLFAVNYIMFKKALPCSKEAYDKIEAAKGALCVLYDLTLTGRDHDFSVSCAVALMSQVLCLAESDKTDETLLKHHLREQMALSEYRELKIEVFRDTDAFCDALRKLDDLRAEKGIDMQETEDSWQPGTLQTMNGILKSISL